MELTTRRGAGVAITGALVMALGFVVGLIADGAAGGTTGGWLVTLVASLAIVGGLIALVIGLGVIAWVLVRQPQRD